MAFITNQKSGGKKLGDRLSELVGHSKQLDMLVGFFFFSGVKIIYEALKLYKPKGLLAHGGMPDHVQAVNVISKLRGKLSSDMKQFAAMVAEDIQTYGTIPLRTIRRLALCDRFAEEEKSVGELQDVLQSLRELRGDEYLAPIRERAASEAILVTIEKH